MLSCALSVALLCLVGCLEAPTPGASAPDPTDELSVPVEDSLIAEPVEPVVAVVEPEPDPPTPVGTWAEPGQCRNMVYVFTPDGHYFHMTADRSVQYDAVEWSVVKGIYGAESNGTLPPYSFDVSDNGAMEGYDIEVATLTESRFAGAYNDGCMGCEPGEPDDKTAFNWARCEASAHDEWPY